MNDEARKRWHQYAKENLDIDPETRWKQFYELNKEELDADYKKIEEMKKEKARTYYKEHKEEIKARKDPEKEKARHARYYEKNKESILKRLSTPVVCECGCTVNHGKMARHKKTKKHIDLMNAISQ